jgi:hypothetical protein
MDGAKAKSVGLLGLQQQQKVLNGIVRAPLVAQCQ